MTTFYLFSNSFFFCLIVYVLSVPKATSAEAEGRATTTATTKKEAMRKGCFPARIKPATVIQRLQVRLHCLFLSSHRCGGSSLGFRAGSLWDR